MSDKVVLDGQGVDIPCQFITGVAGSGKTHLMRQRIAEDPSYGRLAATTGISAVNLGTITINSLLRYFDTESLEEAFYNGFLERMLWLLATEEDNADVLDYDDDRPSRGVRNLVIDEISMMDARQLNVIHEATRRISERLGWKDRPPLGIIAVGDFCQLPPVKAAFAFEAECWPRFEANTTKLEKVWRQTDARFLEALNLIRAGRGRDGVDVLTSLGIKFKQHAEQHFDGTTILPKNDMVDRFNWMVHSKLTGAPHFVTSARWGEQRSEWKQVPETLTIKDGAYVMILSNSLDPETKDLIYVNGDCGHVVGYDEDYGTFRVELVRTGGVVEVGTVTRDFGQKQPPDDIWQGEDEDATLRQLKRDHNVEQHPELEGQLHWNPKTRRWVLGQITYYPIRLAYASTVHKTQGLTLDRIQVDCNHHFFGSPSMAYVALSRCRTPEGLSIIGSPALLAQRVKIDPRVRKYI